MKTSKAQIIFDSTNSMGEIEWFSILSIRTMNASTKVPNWKFDEGKRREKKVCWNDEKETKVFSKSIKIDWKVF